VGLLPFGAVIALCYVWWRVVYSYRQLNSGKFAVIHEMERVMPMALFKGEWVAMGEGKDHKKYLPLTCRKLCTFVFWHHVHITWLIILFL
jgi:hypothetical protein